MNLFSKWWQSRNTGDIGGPVPTRPATALIEALDSNGNTIASAAPELSVIIEGQELVTLATGRISPGRKCTIYGYRLSAGRHETLVNDEPLTLSPHDSIEIKMRLETTDWTGPVTIGPRTIVGIE